MCGVRTGATGAIAPVDFDSHKRILKMGQDLTELVQKPPEVFSGRCLKSLILIKIVIVEGAFLIESLHSFCSRE